MLSLRYGRELLYDRRFVVLLALQPLVVGWLLRAAAGVNDNMMILFLSAVAAFWFGLSNAAPEVVEEGALVQRELRVGIRPISYVGSKALILGLCALLQVSLLVAVLSFMHPWIFHIPLPLASDTGHFTVATGGLVTYGKLAMVLFFVSLVGTMMGLTVSTLATSVSQAIAAVPLITIPHLAFTQKVFGVEPAGTLRGLVVLFNAIEHGYWWLADIHDSSNTCSWHLGPISIQYAFVALVVMIAGLFLLSWFVLQRRHRVPL